MSTYEYDKFNKHFGFTLADNGLLMYEGNYKTRTKESVFSWDIVIGIIKELINDGNGNIKLLGDVKTFSK